MKRPVGFLVLGIAAANAFVTFNTSAQSGPAAAQAASADPSPSAKKDTPPLKREVVLRNLAYPWDIAFTPDGAMLYTEKARGLSVRRVDGGTALLFAPADLLSEGQSGMQGVAVDPQFPRNRTIYVYMSSTAGGSPDNRVIRLTLDTAYTSVGDRTDILTAIPYKTEPAPGAPPGRGAHNGGVIRFGPDSLLYVTTGDNHSPTLPQNLKALGGKVLRVTRDGQPAAGNNTPAGGDPRIYAWGFRNVQGIAFRPGNGQAVIAEHGPRHSDEVTALTPGSNGGWDPICLDGKGYCGYTTNQKSSAPTPMTDMVKFPNAAPPMWNNNGRSEGMAGATFITGPQWGAWNGALAVTFLRGQRVELLRFDAAGRMTGSTPVLDSVGARIRTVVRAPDGSLYLNTDGKSGGDEIWRVEPVRSER